MAPSKAAPSSSPEASSSSAPSSPAPTAGKKRKSAAEVDEIAVDLSLPEPPSKRARRALKKGKPLPAPSSSKRKKNDTADLEQDDDNDVPQLKDAAAKKERSQFGVWIGNLPFWATRADIFRWLVDNSGGSITEDAITRVNLPLSKEKRSARPPPAAAAATTAEDESKPTAGASADKRENRGFAYVDFATYDACIAAVALSETEYGGRRLLIKDSKSFEGRPAPTASSTSAAAAPADDPKPASTSTKIYVGNLPFEATEDVLWHHFEKCGAIQWAKVASFEDSGKCKGYGWVKFAEPAAAEWAVKGFVKIKEAIETEDDFIDDNNEDDEDDADGVEDGDKKPKRTKAPLEQKTKMRKWWVNRLKGRTLTIQIAEDDQTRYKKRFGKDAPKKADKAQKPTASRDAGSTADKASEKKVEKKEKSMSYHDDINVARLTGAAVAPQGKKVTFD